jgi:hypothetical protein
VLGRGGQKVALHVDDQKRVRGTEGAEPKGHT